MSKVEYAKIAAIDKTLRQRKVEEMRRSVESDLRGKFEVELKSMLDAIGDKVLMLRSREIPSSVTINIG